MCASPGRTVQAFVPTQQTLILRAHEYARHTLSLCSPRVGERARRGKTVFVEEVTKEDEDGKEEEKDCLLYTSDAADE